jgi:hypothetical protein
MFNDALENTRILFIQPWDLGNEVGPLRSAADLAGTMIHEYVHLRGFNEWRAFKEQFLFLGRLMMRRQVDLTRPGLLPKQFGGMVVRYLEKMGNEGRKAASDYLVEATARWGYWNPKESAISMYRMTSFADGNKDQIIKALGNRPSRAFIEREMRRVGLQW